MINEIERVDLGWGYPVPTTYPANKYPVPLKQEYKGYTKMYKVIKMEVK